MERCYSEKEYLNQIIEPVRRCCKRYGYLPSVLIAQSCLENGYGIAEYWDNPQIETLLAVNNMVGLKRELLNKSWVDIGLSVWQGGYIRKKTPEQIDGKIVIVSDDFRTYDSIERSFADYLCFMSYASNSGPGGEPKYGQKVLTIKDPETLIRTVSSLGYATGATYPNSVMRIVNKHNLTQYDDLAGVTPTPYTPTIKINPNPNFEPEHNTYAREGGIEFIALHYVGALGDAKANVEYYNQLSTTGASADFYCGFAGDIWQYNMDIEKRACKAVGGGRQTSYGGAFFGVAKNMNVVSVEMCVRNSTGKGQEPNSPTWYFEQATVDSAVRLVQYLMDKYHIPLDHVIRHYDVNGKLCPGVVGWNDASGDDSKWVSFKKRLVGDSPLPHPVTMYRVQVGAYEKKANATNRANTVKSKTRYDCFIERGDDKMYRVYCGSFEQKANAERRVKELQDEGIACFISEVNNV